MQAPFQRAQHWPPPPPPPPGARAPPGRGAAPPPPRACSRQNRVRIPIVPTI
ncbi:hypothetical protein NIB76_24650 [Burkholderia multivorans]|uniref:hypothetical protein n=1 Tax=Burkholderia multivorans TaxID=87883 RepID=UPI0020983F8A|nr:hypothetical protein [Burkholderia multivorans]MCO7343385.1 hypothetical protein [Burkholderia multivorans]